MKDSRYLHTPGLSGIVRVNISVVILDAETKHPHIATLKSFSQGRVLKKFLHCISGMLDRKSCLSVNRINTCTAVARADKMLRFHIYAPRALPDLPLKKFIIRSVFLFFIIPHIQMVHPDKRLHCCCRNP